MSMASRPHSSSRDLVENILDAGLPPDEVALEVSCEEIVSLALDYRDLEEQLERMKHRIECADTPLMRDVLAERDGLKEQVESMQRAGKIVNAENDRLLTEGRRIQEQLEVERVALRIACRDLQDWHADFRDNRADDYEPPDDGDVEQLMADLRRKAVWSQNELDADRAEARERAERFGWTASSPASEPKEDA